MNEEKHVWIYSLRTCWKQMLIELTLQQARSLHSGDLEIWQKGVNKCVFLFFFFGERIDGFLMLESEPKHAVILSAGVLFSVAPRVNAGICQKHSGLVSHRLRKHHTGKKIKIIPP